MTATGPDHPVEKTAQDARQGATPHVTRYVLAWSMGLVVVAFAIIWLVFYN